MQKTLLVFASLLTLNLTSLAQSKHEVSLGFGFGTTNEADDAASTTMTEFFNALFLLESYSEDVKYSAAWHVGYKTFLTKKQKLAVGATFAYQSVKGNYSYSGEKAGDLHRNFYTIAAEADYRYIKKEKFHLYSGLGLGYTFGNETLTPIAGSEQKTSSGNFDLQIIGIGARYGNNVGGFMELGFGYKGIICAGFFFRR
ncbi:outer membrane beta-barrel protein [Pinibacter aurantiacus]|uniref:Outer membrane beta-barrel protein n=1 Tax=Pinibacter aurantiacus TaxID=2851599 RepID=A0A9E2W975_9BACT|nr:outer membrane beta-barrel protein [Pinibacter aurantiacus]MBV4359656.1 outer membrane beta-barrel protein [Pinibacter aurantiacus]